MGAIGGFLGIGGGTQGTGYAAPTYASQLGTTNENQIGGAYAGAQNSLNSQQQLLAALQGQQGLQNQNQVYGQLQGIANGTGPNAAQAQYTANIQNLAQQQAGALASQKGISPALQARLISQQGSAAMQNAAAQGAANQAAQQIAATGAAGQLANTQAAQQIGQTNANLQGQQNEQQMILNAAANTNQNATSQQNNINSLNAGLAGQNLGYQQNAFQGVTGALGNTIGGTFGSSIGKNFGAAEGGMVDDYAGGGKVKKHKGHQISPMVPNAGMQPPIPSPMPSPQQDSFLHEYLRNWKPGGASMMMPSQDTAVMNQQAPMPMSKGGKVDAMVSPGEGYIPPQKVKEVEHGKNPLAVAKKFPGKPKVPGNSYENDVLPAKLEKGGIVLPNSVMQSKEPGEAAMRFVNAILSQKKGKK